MSTKQGFPENVSDVIVHGGPISVGPTIAIDLLPADDNRGWICINNNIEDNDDTKGVWLRFGDVATFGTNKFGIPIDKNHPFILSVNEYMHTGPFSIISDSDTQDIYFTIMRKRPV